MPKLKINDLEITVAPGTLLLDACAQAGIDIPSFCYHPALSPVATCRMCLVEIKGQPKLATSCTTMAGEGQEVFTNSASVADGRCTSTLILISLVVIISMLIRASASA